MTEKVICFYHNDMDGIASASIVKKVYPDAKFVKVDYGDKWDVKDIIDSTCIIVDFSFPDMQELKQYPDRLIWMDHHKSAMEKQNQIWQDVNIDGIRSLEKSGCELTWEYFFANKKMPRAIELIGDRDMWKFKYGEKTRAFHEYTSMVIKSPDINILEDDLVEPFTSRGLVLLRKKQEQIRRAFEQGIDVTFHSCKTRLINTNVNVSETGEYCYKDKDYPIALIWSVRKEKVICSLRSNSIDVGLIASKHGGGGHKFASGFEGSFNFITKLISDSLRENK